MARVVGYDEHVAPGGAAAEAAADALRSARWWASPEAWTTLMLVILVQLPVIVSLQAANWVNEMPSMMAAALAGLAAGWVLAQSPWRGAVASAAGVAVGAVVVIGLVLQRVQPAEELGRGPAARWQEFALRMQDWWVALLNGGISTDALPFVVLLVAVLFAVAYLCAWAVVRWQNAWAALIPGGIVLLTNISYLPGQPSLALVLYLTVGMLLVTRLEFLHAAARWRRERAYHSESISFDVLVVTGAAALVLLAAAWAVPTANHWGSVGTAWQRAMAPVTSRVNTFGELFVGINSKKHLPVHSFGAALPLQGKMTLGSTALYAVTAPAPGALRGAVYDAYTGSGWKLTGATAVPLPAITQELAGEGTAQTRAQVRRPVTVQVEVLAPGTPERRLLAAGDPLAADVGARGLFGPGAEVLSLVPNDAATPGKTYTTVGSLSAASNATLQAAGTVYPPGLLERYGQLSGDLPPEVADLARELTAAARTPYEAARRVEAYLRANYTFTLEPPPAPPRRDAVAAFLFDQRAGYFDQFASAMAVLLRTTGIPTRVATGFVLDPADLNSETKAYAVSEQRAWAWAEVYFPNLGWVEFNPTPSRALVRRAGDDADALAAAAEARLGPGSGSVDNEYLAFADPAEAANVDAGPRVSLRQAAAVAARLLAVLLLLASAALLARTAWRRHFDGLRPAAARWAKVQLLAAWAGISPPDSLTPVEAAAALAPPVGAATALHALARGYTRDRYGPARAAAESDEEARGADRDYRSARDGLRALIVRRLLRLGRVPNAAPTPPAPLLARRHAAATARR